MAFFCYFCENIYKAGFRYIDINLCDAWKDDPLLISPNWKDNAKRLSLKAKEIADSTGQSAVELWNSDNMQKVRSTSLRTTKVITGMQAVEDRKKSIKNR